MRTFVHKTRLFHYSNNSNLSSNILTAIRFYLLETCVLCDVKIQKECVMVCGEGLIIMEQESPLEV